MNANRGLTDILKINSIDGNQIIRTCLQILQCVSDQIELQKVGLMSGNNELIANGYKDCTQWLTFIDQFRKNLLELVGSQTDQLKFHRIKIMHKIDASKQQPYGARVDSPKKNNMQQQQRTYAPYSNKSDNDKTIDMTMNESPEDNTSRNNNPVQRTIASNSGGVNLSIETRANKPV